MKTFSLIVALGVVVGACGAGTGAARDQWASSQPSEYVIEACIDGFASHVCQAQAVSAGHIVAAREGEERGTWRDINPAQAKDLVESMFHSAESGGGDCTVRNVSFEPSYGYVSHYSADCGEEGYGKNVTCFVAGTTDISACGAPGQ